MSVVWKKCSQCKKEIGLGAKYYVCSVSTCQHPRRGLQFCSVSCWSAHVPVLRHKSAWAEERSAPLVASPSEDSRERILVRPAVAMSGSGSAAPAAHKKTLPRETLIVVSKLKGFVRELCDYNTSADVVDWLSDHVRELCVQAYRNAQEDGRKTVMARDFEKIQAGD